jgi:hypothetical protein
MTWWRIWWWMTWWTTWYWWMTWMQWIIWWRRQRRGVVIINRFHIAIMGVIWTIISVTSINDRVDVDVVCARISQWIQIFKLVIGMRGFIHEHVA